MSERRHRDSSERDWEKDRTRRIAAAKRKRAKQLRKNIILGAGIAIGLFVILIGGIKIKNKISNRSDNTEIAADEKKTSDEAVQNRSIVMEAEHEVGGTPEVTPTPTPEVPQQPAEPQPENPEPAPEEAAAPAPTPAPYIPDRSNFAVDPNIPCGADHNNGQNIVYLTLDDGPSYLTAQVLDILDQYGAKATFFVTAQDPEYFYMIKEAYDRGHTIGLHSYTHDYATIYTSVDAYFDDLNRMAQVVQEQIGYVPCFIRFPGGEANMISADYCPGIMSQLVSEVRARGFQYYNWHVSSGDGGNIDDVDTLVANATACDYPNIILLSHDSGGKEATVAALPRIIEYYQSQGYEFRALDREAFCVHADVRN